MHKGCQRSGYEMQMDLDIWTLKNMNCVLCIEMVPCMDYSLYLEYISLFGVRRPGVAFTIESETVCCHPCGDPAPRTANFVTVSKYFGDRIGAGPPYR